MSMNQVFISYSSKDSEYALGIVSILKELGISYWKAPEMISAGANYAKEIPRAIRESDGFIILISKHSQNSIWVEKELDNAINLRKRIIPIQIDNEPLNDMYLFYLNNVQMIPYQKQRKEFMEILCQQLGCHHNTQHDEWMENGKEKIVKQNAFTYNKAPTECKYCKSNVHKVSVGVYECVNCGKENYDYYQSVRKYLYEHGAATAMEIERETGVPRRVIDHFIREDSLQIAGGSRKF